MLDLRLIVFAYCDMYCNIYENLKIKLIKKLSWRMKMALMKQPQMKTTNVIGNKEEGDYISAVNERAELNPSTC